MFPHGGAMRAFIVIGGSVAVSFAICMIAEVIGKALGA